MGSDRDIKVNVRVIAATNKNLKKENQITQIYHYSNEGKISWYEFAKEIFTELKKLNFLNWFFYGKIL